jgi:hypothetical protein
VIRGSGELMEKREEVERREVGREEERGEVKEREVGGVIF